MTTSDKAIPITILTGFLGAGKTTLLNRILNSDHGLRVAVLVNDFGAINIDADLVVQVDKDVISLANGCVCCTIRDDLVETVIDTINRPEAPEYIVLEASGVADPAGIAMTFVNSDFRDRIRLDSVTCVMDADQVFAHPESSEATSLKLRQVAFSDILILNKVDLAGPQQTRKIRDWINDTFNRLRVVESTRCDVPLEILLSVGRFDPAQAAARLRKLPGTRCLEATLSAHHHGHDHNHAATFATWSYQTEEPLSLDALHEVARRLPGNIYRCKGIVHASEEPERPAVLQVVGRRVDISKQAEWGNRVRRSQIVVIGLADSIDAASLEAAFASCIQPTKLWRADEGDLSRSTDARDLRAFAVRDRSLSKSC